MTKVAFDDGLLVIGFSLFERLKAGRGSVSVELWRVRFVLVEEPERRKNLGMQIEGRTAHTGVFLKRGERSFVYWPKRTAAVVIQVHDPFWNEIIIGDDAAKEIASALRLEVAKQKTRL
jgi:hypothetical protein